jgi:peroxiredoxin Q/BCP
MSTLNTGDKAPDFSLPADNNSTISLSDYKGQWIVIYFYPKDDTPGCTTESCSFRDHRKDFEKLGAQIIGISKDSIKKHDKFKAKYDLNFPLVSDENSDMCERYGVWVEKSMYGKKYMGIERSTFLIDKKGNIAQIWRSVKVPGHVEDVALALKNLSKEAA